MHKRMGTVTVLLVLLMASLSVMYSDNSDAWSGTNIPPDHLGDTTYTYTATEVTSFTFPESKGIPVMNELYYATESIYISVYLISSKDTLALLCQKADEGVTVNVLTDGTPLGVTLEKEALMQLDQQYGADVRLINFKGATGTEFDYLHNKYAVIDGDTVIITSENWTQGNFSSSTGNRGWGTIIKSVDYAQYMSAIFQQDFTDDDDVEPIEKVYDPSIAKTETYTAYSVKTYTTTVTDTNVKVYPVHSPDTSYTLMKEFMGTATTRLYVEMLDVSDTYIDYTKSTSPINWIVNQTSKCSDVKYILDTSYEDDKDKSHSELIYSLNHNTDVKASHIKGGKGFSITHNKGIIADNAVWVGSVNMTPTSFKEDREVAVIIYSQKIADYYAGYFTTDFNNNYDPEYGPVTTYTYKFMDGDTLVNTVTFTADTVSEQVLPAVPTRSGYNVAWDVETFALENRTVHAVYTYIVPSSSNTDIEINLDADKFIMPSEQKETVNVIMANGSVKVLDAKSLADKTVTASINKITNTTGVNGTAYELVFETGGSGITGAMQVTLTYKGEDGKKPVVYYVNGSVKEEMNVVSYNSTSVTFETTHNSVYVVALEDDDNAMMLALIAAIAVIVIAAAFVFVKKVILGGAKGGKKGAKKAAKSAGKSAAKKIAKSAVKEYTKTTKKKKK